MYTKKDWKSKISKVLDDNNIVNEKDVKEVTEAIGNLLRLKESIIRKRNRTQLKPAQIFSAQDALGSLNDLLVATILLYSNDEAQTIPLVENGKVVGYTIRFCDRTDIINNLKTLEIHP